jgi:hypothetical protein
VAQAAALTVPDSVVKVCETCGRFRSYDAADRYCVVCGYDTLADACQCGRSLEYALGEREHGGLHCPRCGRDWRKPPTAT